MRHRDPFHSASATSNLAILRAYLRQPRRAGQRASVVAIMVVGDELLPAPCGEGSCTRTHAQQTGGGETGFDGQPGASSGDDVHIWDDPVQPSRRVWVSDEEMSCTAWTARQQLYDEAPLVLRQYYTPGCSSRANVLTIPLGVKGGAVHTHTERRAGRRKYICASPALAPRTFGLSAVSSAACYVLALLSTLLLTRRPSDRDASPQGRLSPPTARPCALRS
jgi:hypothetical protein